METNQFRLDLKSIEDSEEGIPFDDTHVQLNTEVTIAGVTYARGLQIINGYSITFEDGQYSVRLEGSNNDFWDIESGILNQNQVQVIPTNSAGLQIVTQGSGVTEQDKIDIATLVWNFNNVELQVDEIHKIHGLNPTSSLNVTHTERTVANISQSISTTGTGSAQETLITRL